MNTSANPSQTLQPQSAIDGENLAGDKLRARHKKHHRLGHIVCRTVAPHRRASRKPGACVK